MEIHDITEKEKSSLKIYQGSETAEEVLKSWGNLPMSELYGTLNILMYSGIQNECVRIAEHRPLYPALFRKVEEIVNLYEDLFSIMKKTKKMNNRDMIVYRTERGQASELFKHYQRTLSFTSTSKLDSFTPYFEKKKDLAILVFRIPKGTPYIDVNQVLGDKNNIYKNEEEILLPPYLNFDMKEVSLSDKEKLYRDIEGKPPVGKFEISINNRYSDLLEDDRKLKLMEEQLYNWEEKEFMVDFLDKLCNGKKVEEKEIKRYSAWKKCFQQIIKNSVSSVFDKA